MTAFCREESPANLFASRGIFMHIQYVFNVVDLTSVLVLFWSSPNWCQHRWPGVLRIPDFQTGDVMFQIPIIYPINPIYHHDLSWIPRKIPCLLVKSHETILFVGIPWTSHLFPSHLFCGTIVPGGLQRARRTAAAGRAGAPWSLGGGAAVFWGMVFLRVILMVI